MRIFACWCQVKKFKNDRMTFNVHRGDNPLPHIRNNSQLILFPFLLSKTQYLSLLCWIWGTYHFQQIFDSLITLRGGTFKGCSIPFIPSIIHHLNEWVVCSFADIFSPYIAHYFPSSFSPFYCGSRFHDILYPNNMGWSYGR